MKVESVQEIRPTSTLRVPSAEKRLTNANTPSMQFGKVTSVVHSSERNHACPGRLGERWGGCGCVDG